MKNKYDGMSEEKLKELLEEKDKQRDKMIEDLEQVEYISAKWVEKKLYGDLI